MSIRAMDSDTIHFLGMTISAFVAFSCTFAIRTTLYVGEFRDEYLGFLQLKVAFALFQTMGFFLGKFPSTAFIPTVPESKRFVTCSGLYAASVFFFCGVGLLSSPLLQCICVFISGLFISPLWGVIIMYLEGRALTEALLSVLSLSPILASGVARFLGVTLLRLGFTDHTMPMMASALSLAAFTLSMKVLDCMPPPSELDVALRSKRKPITIEKQQNFIKAFYPGILPITVCYSLMSGIRAYRDYFVLEIISESHIPDYEPSSLIINEIPIALVSLLSYGYMSKIQDNWRAFSLMLLVMIAGCLSIVISTTLHEVDMISTMTWLCFVGIGLYLAYIPPGSMLYDRLMSIIRRDHTSVFLIYLSDACGYLFTISLLLWIHITSEHKREIHKVFHFAEFFAFLCSISGLASIVFILYSFQFFNHVRKKLDSGSPPHTPDVCYLRNF